MAFSPITAPSISKVSGLAITIGSVAYSLTASYALVSLTGGGPFQLPITAAGAYIVTANVDITGATSGDDVRFKIYDSAASAYVANTETLVSIDSNGEGSASLQFPYTASGATNLQLYAVNNTAARGSIAANTSRLSYISVSSASTHPLPNITSFTPAYGVSTSVAITGTGFTGATAVSFNGTAATSYTVNSDTSITATSPASFTNGPILITTLGGTATSSTNYTQTAPAAVLQVGHIYSENGDTNSPINIGGVTSSGANSLWVLGVYSATQCNTPTLNGVNMNTAQVSTDSSGKYLGVYYLYTSASLSNVTCATPNELFFGYIAQLVEYKSSLDIIGNSSFTSLNYSAGTINLSPVTTANTGSTIYSLVGGVSNSATTAGTGYSLNGSHIIDANLDFALSSETSTSTFSASTTVTPTATMTDNSSRAASITFEIA